MRLPYPERISLRSAVLFAGALFCGQILVGTSFYFAGCVFAYILVATLAFNVAGGLYRPSGVFVFFNAALGLILSQWLKVILAEPAQSNLMSPNLAITVYLAGEVSILAAVYLARRLTPSRAILEKVDDAGNMLQMAAGCLIIGGVLPWLPTLLGNAGTAAPGSLSAFLNHFVIFMPLAVVLATYHEIKSSRGTRSTNIIVVAALIYGTSMGILGSSKQGILEPIASYIFTCAVLRFRFKVPQIASMLLFAVVFWVYLYPYAQIARNYFASTPTLGTRIDAEFNLLSHPQNLRNQYRQSIESTYATIQGPHYYNSDTELAGRYSMIVFDSYLIDRTEAGYSIGLYPLVVALQRLVPHFIMQSDNNADLGNIYAHQIGMLAEDDTTTGISFGLFSEPYFMAKWTGVLVILPITMTIVFIIWDSFLPDFRKSPWGLPVGAYFINVAGQALLTLVIGYATTLMIVIVLTILFARFIAPMIGALFVLQRSSADVIRNPPRAIPHRTSIL